MDIYAKVYELELCYERQKTERDSKKSQTQKAAESYIFVVEDEAHLHWITLHDRAYNEVIMNCQEVTAILKTADMSEESRAIYETRCKLSEARLLHFKGLKQEESSKSSHSTQQFISTSSIFRDLNKKNALVHWKQQTSQLYLQVFQMAQKHDFVRICREALEGLIELLRSDQETLVTQFVFGLQNYSTSMRLRHLTSMVLSDPENRITGHISALLKQIFVSGSSSMARRFLHELGFAPFRLDDLPNSSLEQRARATAFTLSYTFSTVSKFGPLFASQSFFHLDCNPWLRTALNSFKELDVSRGLIELASANFAR
ncbi:hypothetical protein Ciccas_010452 [Cichlidogyrus casuarinus]|uniref:Uncharacterized protein n=1 Tax=Cichlidogyrus casuarinus TaxID=1844966 RepID=A0ABD2PUW6_9PLAT